MALLNKLYGAVNKEAFMDDFRNRALKPSWLNFDEFNSPQQQGKKRPEVVKIIDATIDRIKLPTFDFDYLDVYNAIKNRRSVRKYQDGPITLEVLSYLLYATQGIEDPSKPFYRSAPSAGARHAIETYVYCDRVEGLTKGLYLYLPLEHSLVLVHHNDINVLDEVEYFTFGAPCTFMWTAIPYRMEWRYAHCSEKLILLDAGHICQNLYLACESIGFGTCAVGAYDQDALDNFLDVDGENEFLIYAAPVGLK